MDKKKIIIAIIIIVVIAIYGFMVIVMSNNNNNLEEPLDPNNSSTGNTNEPSTTVSDSKYLAISNYSIWRLSNDSWNNSKILSEDELYKVYINNNYFGNYYLKKGNSWNLFDENNKFVSYDGEFLACSTNMNVSIKNYIINTVSSEDLTTISSKVGANITLESLTNNEKVIIDLDNNGINDEIVNVSNLDAEAQTVYFNLIYVKLNNIETQVLFNDKIDETDVLIEPIYNIKYVLNIGSDTYSSIVFQKGYFSNSGQTGNVMYQYKENEYSKVIEDK